MNSNNPTQKTLLAVLAHPDDETFGMGGTLAYYARAGVSVHLVCATKGEAGEADEAQMKGFSSMADLRVSELNAAAKILGLSGVHFLGYRDSGMPGSPDNQHPDALIGHSLDEVAEKVTYWIRELHPQVVVTFDPIGGYRHPDHIHIQQAAVKAFHAAGDPLQYADQKGPQTTYRPDKLYFHITDRRYFRFLVRALTLMGKDPKHFGRNHDVDLTSFTSENYPTHAVIDYSSVAQVRADAAACHASQGGGNMARGIQGWLLNHLNRKEMFMRAYPEPRDGEPVERDLFAGI